MRVFRTLLSTIALLVLATTATADDEATTPTQRIISCAPNLTEMVYELGAGDDLAGVSTHTNYPPEAAELPKVVDLFNPNLEAILRLEPTMILALPSNTKITDFFEDRSDVELVVTGEIETFEQIRGAVMLLGRKLNRKAAAQEFLKKNPVPKRKKRPEDPPKALFVVGHGPGLSQLYAVGHGTFLNQLIERAGAKNVVPADMQKYPVLSKEALIRMNPEIIIQSIEEGADAEEHYARAQREWKKLSTLKAVREDDFRFVAGDDISIPGPRAFELLPIFERLIWETEPGGSINANQILRKEEGAPN